MKLEDVKVTRVLIEDTVSGEHEVRDADGAMAFAVKDGELKISVVGSFGAAAIMEIISFLGTMVAVGAKGPAAKLAASRLALLALTDGMTDQSEADRVISVSAANEVVYGVES